MQRKAKVVAVGVVANGAVLHRQRIIRVLRGCTGRVRLPASWKFSAREGVFTGTGHDRDLRWEVS